MVLLVLAVLLAAVLLGSWVYCVLIAVAAASYGRVQPPAPAGEPEPISILKPLHGLDEGLEANLRTFFEQDYPRFELLFAARDASDPAWAVVNRLRASFLHVPVRIFITGEPPYPNAKVFSLDHMLRAAQYDLVVMSDSDIRAPLDLLRIVGREFQATRLAVATCPYRAVPGRSFWSTLEAIGMNTEFWGGCLTARLVEGGVHFAVGPTTVARRGILDEIGGFTRFREYLAEDFVMGQFAAEAGYGVILSSAIVEHHIGSQAWQGNFAHRLRWNRSSRRSRPAGYIGQLFTNPLPLALLLTAVWPAAWPVLVVTAVFRAVAAHAVSHGVLADPLCRRRWFWIPLQDILSFVFWLGGFWGNTIVWRGRTYRLHADGRFELRES